MGVLKGDFIGFSYNGIHSSDLGIVRTSNGSRFEKNLLPTMQDKTATVPGGDGTYYFNSQYTQRQFNVSFAFDSLTEEQFNFLSFHFGDKKVHPLVFDEEPYKTYYAKVTGTASIKYICFDESKGEKKLARVYKGEGSVVFTCYQSLAVCEKKYLDAYNEWANKSEWAKASGLLENSTTIVDGVAKSYDVFTYASSDGAIMNLYNPGDKPSDWKLEVNLSAQGRVDVKSIKLEVNNEKVATCEMEMVEIVAKAHPLIAGVYDSKVVFDSKTGLVEGYYLNDQTKAWEKSGNLYNEVIVEGDFFKIPITVIKSVSGVKSDGNNYQLVIGSDSAFEKFVYNYYYY